jgi:predicted Ser/Thr protein kinase
MLLFLIASPMLNTAATASRPTWSLARLFGRRRIDEPLVRRESPAVSMASPKRDFQATGSVPELQKDETGPKVAGTAVTEMTKVPSGRIETTSAMEPTPETMTPAVYAPHNYTGAQTVSVPPSPDASPSIVNQSPTLAEAGLADSDRITHLGRYQVLGILGKGAMGTVFRGVDPAINRPVALKTIRLDFVSDQEEMSELRDRLFREAQAAGKLSHPNIVTIYDVGSEGSLQYIAMEFLEGQTLESLIRKKVQFSYKIVANMITQVCNALQYAHDQGIVHRDIKPANIMVLPNYSIKVMDFGIARVDSSSMTRTGIAMGTPNYISPEQLQGKSIDRRCDIFSLGVVVYELLTGRRPFKGENLTALIYAIINDDPVPPSSINENIPLIFDHICGKALKKNPTERYQRATEMQAAVADFVDSFAGARKVGL